MPMIAFRLFTTANANRRSYPGVARLPARESRVAATMDQRKDRGFLEVAGRKKWNKESNKKFKRERNEDGGNERIVWERDRKDKGTSEL